MHQKGLFGMVQPAACSAWIITHMKEMGGGNTSRNKNGAESLAVLEFYMEKSLDVGAEERGPALVPWVGPTIPSSPAGLRCFHQNKPGKPSRTHSRPQKPNRISTGKNTPHPTPCSPLAHTHTRAANWNPECLAMEAALTSHNMAGLREDVGCCWDGATQSSYLQTPTNDTCTSTDLDMINPGGRELHLNVSNWSLALKWWRVHGFSPPRASPLIHRPQCREAASYFRIDFLLLQPSKPGCCYIFVSNVRIFCTKSDHFILLNYLDTLHALYPEDSYSSLSSVIRCFLSPPPHFAL